MWLRAGVGRYALNEIQIPWKVISHGYVTLEVNGPCIIQTLASMSHLTLGRPLHNTHGTGVMGSTLSNCQLSIMKILILNDCWHEGYGSHRLGAGLGCHWSCGVGDCRCFFCPLQVCVYCHLVLLSTNTLQFSEVWGFHGCRGKKCFCCACTRLGTERTSYSCSAQQSRPMSIAAYRSKMQSRRCHPLSLMSQS